MLPRGGAEAGGLDAKFAVGPFALPPQGQFRFRAMLCGPCIGQHALAAQLADRKDADARQHQLQKASRRDQVGRLFAPRRQDGGRLGRDGHEHGVMGQCMRRDHTLRAVDPARLQRHIVVRAACPQAPGGAASVEDLSDRGDLLRIAGEQHTVAPQKGYGRILVVDDGFVQVLEIRHQHTREADAQKAAIRGCDPMGDDDGQGVIHSVDERIADDRGLVRIVLQSLEIGPVRDADAWHRPVMGDVDKLAVRVHEPDNVELGQCGAMGCQFPVHFEAGHSPSEVVDGLGVIVAHHLHEGGLHEVDGFEGTLCLVGEGQRQAARFVFGFL